ncbi:MAG: hypothetical protein ACRERC_13260, partial [Candidatus Binatia bacterium]
PAAPTDDAAATRAVVDAALAGRAADDAAAVARATKLQRLAREFTDPLTTLPQLFVQDAYTPANYGTDAGTNRVVVRAIIPRVPKFALLPFVQLIRPSVFLNTVPTGRGSGTRTELGDMQLFDVAVLPWGHDIGLRMGLGPMFIFPTATHRTSGQGAWQMGPTFAAIYKGTPWLIAGALIQNPVSFAYTSSDRPALNTLLFQPILLVAMPRGWYLKSADSTWTMGWHHNTATVLPLSFGVGKVIVHEDWPPLNLFVSGEWTVYRQFAPVAPQTTVRLGMTIAFPDFRPWK